MRQGENVEVLIFKVLSNEVRLAIIKALFKAPMSVNEICETINEEQSRVSHELRCLTTCQFVYFKREGKKMIYELNGGTATQIINAAENHAKLFGDNIKGCNTLSSIKQKSVTLVK